MEFLLGLCMVVALGMGLGIGILIKLRSYNRRIFRIVIIGIVLIICLSLYSGLTVRIYEIESTKIHADEQLKIVLLTDLHSSSYGENQEKLVQVIQKQEPDLILMSGDIIDDEAPITGSKQLLEGLQNTVPIYYVTGNHEYWTGDIEGVKAFMESYGVRVLEEEYAVEEIKGERLVIAGMSDPDKWRLTEQEDSFREVYNELGEIIQQEEGYKILLSHRPELVDLYEEGVYDMVVSGHAHGGQVRIPGIINGLYAPNQGGFPKYAGGMYTLGDRTQLIVSRGLSRNWRLPRIFNPPEVVVLNIKGISEK